VFGYAVVELKDVAKYSSGRIYAGLINENSYVGVENLLQDRRGKSKSNYVPTEGRLTQYLTEDILIGNIRPYLKKIWFADCCGGTNGDVLVIQGKKDLIYPRFLYMVLCSDKFFDYDMQNSRGAKMPRGNKEAVMKYQFCMPTMERQKKIVEILDRFDTLCNDISEGLPSEIEARQKQYEYYREKLLNFKELSE